ncbi:MAG TPA: helix-turn-helix domain-containing protein [Solirubrobacteraceae bacterium]|nr:helix-turn-helix domain-containing protein [Solirubrobacteraceae bacterium]
MVPLEDEDPSTVVAQFACRFDLSRPHVRREINQIEDARALAEHERDESKKKDVTTAERLRAAHTERHREATRADTAEAELERTKRQLRAALGTGGARMDVGIFALGHDAAERAHVMAGFSKNLALSRAKSGLTQRRLAARCFISESHVAALESGESLPSFLVLLGLSRALGVPVEALTDGLAPMTREATRGQLRVLLAKGSGLHSSGQLAEASRLPASYVNTTLHHMRAYGESTMNESGDWALAPQPPTSGGGKR